LVCFLSVRPPDADAFSFSVSSFSFFIRVSWVWCMGVGPDLDIDAVVSSGIDHERRLLDEGVCVD
jgi:hypothetical protein